MNIKHYQ
ncbi:hypothetical protein C6A46_19080 [Escherichia coli]|nr:hypothetical protein C2132_09735 [Escherichia coli]RCE17148.1 hypothetical protein C6A46_19080 [Escherichia coli]RIF68072.1 hypothetical protein CUA50_14395 [Shigella boydii]RIF76897.1 hypothetical protein UL59_14170 [Shigella boydii]RIG75760.1 hypothetical protein UQ94_13925 [Shigella boydii]